ncbi:MAG: NYN domain-containing protein [Acidobacteriota bacterium]
MLKAGRRPKEGVKHIPDIFVWHRETIVERVRVEIIRATYYSYAVGTDQQFQEWSNQIKTNAYDFVGAQGQYVGGGFLYPRLFKKLNREAKRKGVDISIAVDALTHTHHDSIDVAYLISGDGDYKPLIEEIIRSGKQVYLGALSEGLNPHLPNLVDKFFNLDTVYFE